MRTKIQREDAKTLRKDFVLKKSIFLVSSRLSVFALDVDFRSLNG